MAYGSVAADQITTSVANTSLGAGNASIMKNRLINSAMVIDQRNAGASVANNAGVIYTVDRWAMESSQANKMTAQQNAGSLTGTNLPVGFQNYLGITSSSAYSITSGDYFLLEQIIEGFNTADLQWGTTNAKSINLSFWVRSSLTGTFAGNVQNYGNNNRFYVFSYSIPVANTWTYISVTIPGDTSGTWNGATNNGSITLRFGIGVGSGYLGSAGSWGSTAYFGVTGQTNIVATNAATFYITGVQLEVGSSATGFEYRQYQQELALCQRYYEVFTQNGNLTAILSGLLVAGNNWLNIFYKQTKRATPTVAAPSGWTNATPNIFPSIDNCAIGGGIAYFYLSGAGSVLTVSAEL